MTPEEKKEAKRIYDIEYRKRNSEKLKLQKKEWEKNNPDKIKEFRNNRKDKKKIENKMYAQANVEKLNTKKKIWANANKEKVKAARKKYNQANKDKTAKRERERKQNDELYRLKSNIRKSVWDSIKRQGYSKNLRTEEILGCTYEDFKLYLESKFEPWMNWDNYGKYNGEEMFGWDIDHIIPSALALCENEIIKLNHFTNLQPLCSKINRDVKRDIII